MICLFWNFMSFKNPVSLKSVLGSLKTIDWDIQQAKNWVDAKFFKFHWCSADQCDLSLVVTSVIFLIGTVSIYAISYTCFSEFSFAINSFSWFIKIYSTDICNIFQFTIQKFEVEFQVGVVTKNLLLNGLDQLESAHHNNFVILFTISFDLSSTFWIFSLESAKPEAGQR